MPLVAGRAGTAEVGSQTFQANRKHLKMMMSSVANFQTLKLQVSIWAEQCHRVNFSFCGLTALSRVNVKAQHLLLNQSLPLQELVAGAAGTAESCRRRN